MIDENTAALNEHEHRQGRVMEAMPTNHEADELRSDMIYDALHGDKFAEHFEDILDQNPDLKSALIEAVRDCENASINDGTLALFKDIAAMVIARLHHIASEYLTPSDEELEEELQQIASDRSGELL